MFEQWSCHPFGYSAHPLFPYRLLRDLLELRSLKMNAWPLCHTFCVDAVNCLVSIAPEQRAFDGLHGVDNAICPPYRECIRPFCASDAIFDAANVNAILHSHHPLHSWKCPKHFQPETVHQIVSDEFNASRGVIAIS
jgi:hypothetical protein